MTEKKLPKRDPSVYYIPETKDRKAILIFDAGHKYGDIHIYEHKKSVKSVDVEKEMVEKLGASSVEDLEISLIHSWVEKEYGFPMGWKLKQF